MGNYGLFSEYLDGFLNKKIIFFFDFEERREIINGLRRFRMNYFYVLIEKLFFEICFSIFIYIMDLMCDKLL